MTTPLLRNLYFIVNVALAALLSAIPAVAAAAEPASPQAPPAGQVCPTGSFVTGFDNQGNIICGEVSGHGAAGSTESADAAATTSAVATAAVVTESAVPADSGLQSPPVKTATAATQALAIEKIKPWSVPYGTRQVTLEVFGTGFTTDSVVVFQGENYVPSVDQTGTRLEVTLATRNLTMGGYALTVSNGPETRVTLKKALVVY